MCGLIDAAVNDRWSVKAILPAGTNVSLSNKDVFFFKSGIIGVFQYMHAVSKTSKDVDAVLVLANNPAVLWSANGSKRKERTFIMVLSPAVGINVFKEIGASTQTLFHFFAKNSLLARLYDYSNRRFIVSSKYQANQLKKLGAHNIFKLPVVGVSRATEVPNKQEARRLLGWPDGFIVGYLGHFSRAKGVEILIEAVEKIVPRCMLALAYSGKGQLTNRANVRLQRLRQLGVLLEHNFVDKLIFLAACDVVILPYITSSVFHLPQVMLEAFSVATPVITTRVGGVYEIIEQENVGIVVEPRSIEALASAIDIVLTNRDALHTMGRNARCVFEERLCAEAFINSFLELVKMSYAAKSSET